MRLVRLPKRSEGDRLLDERHDFGFSIAQGAACARWPRGAEGGWPGDWQTGGLECQSRERWRGWSRELPFRRLHWVAYNPRLVVLEAGTECAKLGSSELGAHLCWLSANGQAEREQPPPSWQRADLQALRELLEEVPDPRRGPPLRPPLGAVPSLPTLAEICGWPGGRRTEACAKAWPPEAWQALGCRGTGVRRLQGPLGHDLPAGPGRSSTANTSRATGAGRGCPPQPHRPRSGWQRSTAQPSAAAA